MIEVVEGVRVDLALGVGAVEGKEMGGVLRNWGWIALKVPPRAARKVFYIVFLSLLNPARNLATHSCIRWIATKTLPMHQFLHNQESQIRHWCNYQHHCHHPLPQIFPKLSFSCTSFSTIFTSTICKTKIYSLRVL